MESIPQSESKTHAEFAWSEDGQEVFIQWTCLPGTDRQLWQVPTRDAVVAALGTLELVQSDAVTVTLTEDLQQPGVCAQIEVTQDIGDMADVAVAAGQIMRRLIDAGLVYKRSWEGEGGADGA